jgi:CcmD family protein
MKNFESIFAAYMVFWAIVFAYQFTIARRLARAEQDLESLKRQLPRVSTTTEDNRTNASQLSPRPARERYAGTGLRVGGVIGLVYGAGYIISPMNPNQGHLLSLSQNLKLGGIFFTLTFLSSGIGYLMGIVVDRKRSGGIGGAAQ